MRFQTSIIRGLFLAFLMGTAGCNSLTVDIDGNPLIAGGGPGGGAATPTPTPGVSTFELSRSVVSFNEAGAVIGTPLSVTRTVSGISQSVTLTVDAITANATNVTLGSQTISFASGDTSVPVTGALLGVIDDSTLAGDKFFRIKISAPTASGVLGTLVEAQANILDSSLAANTFFFPSSLITTSETSGTASVVVGRNGDTTSSASVQLSFIAGTATAGTDYVATPVTVNFTAGQAEVTASVPIVNRAGYQANRSFFAELTSPSAGTTLRPWATTKIRILDANDSTVCDATNDNTSVNAGFGGGAGTSGDPYRICSLSQFYRVRAPAGNLTQSYRLMKDLDLDPSLDADPVTAGVQPVTPITGLFSGTFNGDERVLKNFRYTHAAAASDPVGLFNLIGGNTSVSLTGLNLQNAYLKSTQAGVNLGGILGKTSGPISTISSCSFSGLVDAAGSGNVGGILNRTNGTTASALIHNFSHGTFTSASDVAGGIFAGNFGDHSDMDHSYSVATVIGGGSTGGLIGDIGGSGPYDLSSFVTNSHAKGLVISTGGQAAGLIGAIWARSGGDVHVTNSFSTGPVRAPQNAAGLIGSLNCQNSSTPSHCDITNSYSSGKIEKTSSTANTFSAGAIGYLATSTALTFNQVSASGQILAPNGAGGLFGRIKVEGTGNTFSITDCHATGNIGTTGVTTDSGGFASGILLDNGSNNTLSISSCSATGNIYSSSNGTYSSGGFIGTIDSTSSSAGNQINITSSSASGNVQGFRNAGGFLGRIYMGAAAGASISITSCTSSGTVTTTDSSAMSVGGFLGNVDESGSYPDNLSLTLSGLTASGNVTSTGTQVGGLIGGMSIITRDSTTTISNSHATGNVSGRQYLGGLIGQMETQSFFSKTSAATISQVYATGTVTGTDESAGGLIGTAGCTASGTKTISISRAYATGNTTGTGRSGGLIGNFYAFNSDCSLSLSNSFSTGTLNADYCAAGLVGYLVDNGPVTVSNSYSLSQVNGTSYNVSGLIGTVGSQTVTNSFWLKDGSVNALISDNGNGAPKTVSQLQTAATYSSAPAWDFATIWNSPGAGVYPSLR